MDYADTLRDSTCVDIWWNKLLSCYYQNLTNVLFNLNERSSCRATSDWTAKGRRNEHNSQTSVYSNMIKTSGQKKERSSSCTCNAYDIYYEGRSGYSWLSSTSLFLIYQVPRRHSKTCFEQNPKWPKNVPAPRRSTLNTDLFTGR